MPTIQSQSVEFPTADGLLRGRLYPAPRKGPAFNLVKEVYIPKIVEYFQQAKITALIYDVRNYGDSDGLPRNELDPSEQVDDYCDAVTYMTGLPMAKLVIAVCPMTHEPLGKYDTEEDEELRRMLVRCTRDRVAQVKGNPPARVPTMTPSSHSVFGCVHFGAGVYDVMMGLRWTVAPSFDLDFFLDTPVMMVIPESDVIFKRDTQLNVCEAIPGPKAVVYGQGKGAP
ncbi:uncharacterized protein BDW43DRAFT_301362 [Aspergillus alliaceus]|uniref:uncharacterized protein n=1 Tax=Petromyces alliaceus TaxID=209559 RepID=UPI0012A6F7FE|nr:uncharacterized protein BDW43DRAFT_301362 [Aspergillus alliaceus]KAB8231933.1 hypothetical protein BDW43DRAFT_301362 [Aspergillus alliaceus]